MTIGPLKNKLYPSANRGMWSPRALTAILLIALFATTGLTVAAPTEAQIEPSLARLDVPPDPNADIPWPAAIGRSTVADIQAAFSRARAIENAQLGTSMPKLTMPSQAKWDSMSDSDRALYLINQERAARGIPEMEGVEPNLTKIAENYAHLLLANNLPLDHKADGKSPSRRINENPTLGACNDGALVIENLYGMFSFAAIEIPVAQAIYVWMYRDKNFSWGHRHTLLWFPYNDNGGMMGKEGFIGLGRASGPYVIGEVRYPASEIIVLNVFDPCAAWVYETPPPPPPPPPPEALTEFLFIPLVLDN